MESTVRNRPVTKRPGGRTAEVTARVHQAITDLIIEGGVDACTFSAVAERREEAETVQALTPVSG